MHTTDYINIKHYRGRKPSGKVAKMVFNISRDFVTQTYLLYDITSGKYKRFYTLEELEIFIDNLKAFIGVKFEHNGKVGDELWV